MIERDQTHQLEDTIRELLAYKNFGETSLQEIKDILAQKGLRLGMGREEGLTKLIFEKGTKRILGAGIVGVNAGELIAETVLALEMGADAEDIGLTIHPHPTLSETIFFSAEMAEGSITDMLPPKR